MSKALRPKAVSRYVFYLGGPQAVVTTYGFWREAGTLRWGCLVTKSVGVRPPFNTYSRADGTVSQVADGSVGYNSTAILPLEV